MRTGKRWTCLHTPPPPFGVMNHVALDPEGVIYFRHSHSQNLKMHGKRGSFKLRVLCPDHDPDFFSPKFNNFLVWPGPFHIKTERFFYKILLL